jgi:transcriptional regulator with XRE-family HTH domain
MSVAEKIKRLTRIHNLSAIAREAGVSHQTMQGIITGRCDPRRGTVTAIARVLEVDAGWLMDDGRGWPPMKANAAEPSRVV